MGKLLRWRISAWLSTSLMLIAVCSCAPSDQPELGQVMGAVTLDGKPLAGVWVGFAPTEGRSSMGLTDSNGRYSLNYLNGTPGAKVGSHSVTITTPQEDEFGGVVKNFKERVPSQYNSKSTLVAEVKSGSNEIDFPLTTRALSRK